jgi:hypothetical protein
LIKNDPDTVSHIEDFSVDKVVLGDYFYSASRSFFTDEPLYSDEQVARILNLTDTEYADLITKITADRVAKDTNQISPDTAHIASEIEQLEQKVKDGRAFEDDERRLSQLKEELSALHKELSSTEDIQNRYQQTLTEYSKYSYLTRFNLTKMHSDLVHLNDQIQRAEEDILNYKGEHIERLKQEQKYDNGKIALAVGWSVAVIIMCVILKLVETPTYIIVIGGGVGLLLSFFFVLTAKVEVEYPLMEENQNTSLQSRHRELEGLKAQREAILKLVNMRTTDDFFHIKAKLGSYVKSLQYLQDQRNKALDGKNYDQMTKRRAELEQEIGLLESKLSDTSKKLTSDQYLSIYRQIDSLKLQQNQTQRNAHLNTSEIMTKLGVIRNELKVKLPGYKDLLKNTFTTSFSAIRQLLDDLSKKISRPPVHIESDGKGYDNLADIEKLMVDYAVVKNIYKKDFVFAVEYLSKKDEETQNGFQKIVEATDPSESKFYILDDKTVL